MPAAEQHWRLAHCLTAPLLGVLLACNTAAAAQPVPLPAQQLRTGPGYVRIEGSIAADLVSQLRFVVGAAAIERVELVNEGGDVDAAIGAGRWLREHGVRRAVVIGRCLSACAYLALMFPHRDLAPLGLMGFHDVQGNQDDPVAIAAGRQRLLKAISANGIAENRIRLLLSTRELRWYSRRELLDAGLITGCWDPRRLTERDCHGT